MSKMAWIRTRCQGKDEVIIMLKYWGFPIHREFSYRDFASSNSERNRCEAELVAAIQTVRKKALALVEAEDTLKGDIKFATDNAGKGRFGVSLPRKVPLKALKEYDTFHEKPDEEIWREALNPKWVAKLGLGKKKSKGSSTSETSSKGSRKTYSTADEKTLSDHHYEFDSDGGEVEGFVHKKGNSSDKDAMKKWKHQWRQDNPFSGEVHGANKDYEKCVTEAWNEHCS